jgi:hypothetical protein
VTTVASSTTVLFAVGGVTTGKEKSGAFIAAGEIFAHYIAVA